MSSLTTTLRSALVRFGPLAIWIATVAGVAYLWGDVVSGGPVVGHAEAVEYRLASETVARVGTLAVEVGQSVAAGQIVATLDASTLEGEIRVYEADRERVRAAIAAAAAEARHSLAADTHDLELEAAKVERDLAQVRAEHGARAAELQALTQQRRALAKLIEDRLASSAELSELDVRQATLRKEVAGAHTRISVLEAQLAGMRSRPSGLVGETVDVVTAPLQHELSMIERRLEQLRGQRDALVLRAPTSGIVSTIWARPGEVVGAGLPVVTLVGDRAERVVACATEEQAWAVEVGQAVTLHGRGGGGGTPLRGHVVALGPVVNQMPLRCRRSANELTWGRDVVVLVDDAAPIVPGQAFSLRFERDPRPSGTAVAARPAATPEGGRLLVIPDELRRLSRFEPSGLVWVPALARYVVASDDTGFDGHAQEGAPWLFTMDAAGRVDPAPLAVAGAKEVSDLEGITVTPSGRLFALASQSLSKKGKRPAKRQAFWRIGVEGRSLRLDGELRLAELLGALSTERLRALGVADLDALDIEGLASDAAGRLYLGLKAPVGPDGEALIWRLDHPDALFASGRLEDAGLSLWARVRLPVEADGREVPGGVSELLWLPDGTLVVASTASAGDPKTQTGRVWAVPEADPDRGPLTPREVRAFAGHKPEGLSLAPHPGRMAVVFDNGDAPPAMVELPWPGR